VHRLVVFVVPVFALLMACEFAWGWLKRRSTYRFGDTIGSLSQGLLSQALAVCTQLFQIGLYAMAYPLVAIWTRPAFWDSAMGWIAAVLLFDFFDYWLHRRGNDYRIDIRGEHVFKNSERTGNTVLLGLHSKVVFIQIAERYYLGIGKELKAGKHAKAPHADNSYLDCHSCYFSSHPNKAIFVLLLYV